MLQVPRPPSRSGSSTAAGGGPAGGRGGRRDGNEPSPWATAPPHAASPSGSAASGASARKRPATAGAKAAGGREWNKSTAVVSLETESLLAQQREASLRGKVRRPATATSKTAATRRSHFARLRAQKPSKTVDSGQVATTAWTRGRRYFMDVRLLSAPNEPVLLDALKGALRVVQLRLDQASKPKAGGARPASAGKRSASDVLEATLAKFVPGAAAPAGLDAGVLANRVGLLEMLLCKMGEMEQVVLARTAKVPGATACALNGSHPLINRLQSFFALLERALFLHDRLRHVLDEADELDSRLERESGAVGQLEAELATVRASMEALEARDADREALLRRYEGQEDGGGAAAAAGAAKGLASSLQVDVVAALRKEVADLHRERKALEVKLAEAKSEAVEAREAGDSVREELAGEQARVGELEAALGEAKAKVAHISQLNEEKLSKAEMRAVFEAELASQLSSHREANGALQKRYADLLVQFEESQSALQRSQAEAADLRTDGAKMKVDMGLVESHSQKVIAEAGAARGDLEETRKQVMVLRRQIEHERSLKDDALLQCFRTTDREKKKSDQVIYLEREAVDLRGEAASYKSQLHAARQAELREQKLRQELETELAAAQHRAETVESDLHQLQRFKGNWQETNDALMASNSKMRDELRELREELRKENARAVEAISRLDESAAAVKEAESRAREAETETRRVQAQALERKRLTAAGLMRAGSDKVLAHAVVQTVHTMAHASQVSAAGGGGGGGVGGAAAVTAASGDVDRLAPELAADEYVAETASEERVLMGMSRSIGERDSSKLRKRCQEMEAEVLAMSKRLAAVEAEAEAQSKLRTQLQATIQAQERAKDYLTDRVHAIERRYGKLRASMPGSEEDEVKARMAASRIPLSAAEVDMDAVRRKADAADRASADKLVVDVPTSASTRADGSSPGVLTGGWFVGRPGADGTFRYVSDDGGPGAGPRALADDAHVRGVSPRLEPRPRSAKRTVWSKPSAGFSRAARQRADASRSSRGSVSVADVSGTDPFARRRMAFEQGINALIRDCVGLEVRMEEFEAGLRTEGVAADEVRHGQAQLARLVEETADANDPEADAQRLMSESVSAQLAELLKRVSE